MADDCIASIKPITFPLGFAQAMGADKKCESRMVEFALGIIFLDRPSKGISLTAHQHSSLVRSE